MLRGKSVSDKQSYAEVRLGAHSNLHGDGIIDNKHNILHIIPKTKSEIFYVNLFKLK